MPVFLSALMLEMESQFEMLSELSCFRFPSGMMLVKDMLLEISSDLNLFNVLKC